jgi:hypothetical protein
MPELPDIAAYNNALEPRIMAQPMVKIRLASPFLVRTAQPPLTDVENRIVRELRRIGKRIAIGGRRPVGCPAPADRRTSALARALSKAGVTADPGSF